jgi:hypothetical protein
MVNKTAPRTRTAKSSAPGTEGPRLLHGGNPQMRYRLRGTDDSTFRGL